MGGAAPISDWRSETPGAQYLSFGIHQVGVQYGLSVLATDFELVAMAGDLKAAVAKSFGQGRVFVFADDWIALSSFWTYHDASEPNPFDPCYDADAGRMRTAEGEF